MALERGNVDTTQCLGTPEHKLEQTRELNVSKGLITIAKIPSLPQNLKRTSSFHFPISFPSDSPIVGECP